MNEVAERVMDVMAELGVSHGKGDRARLQHSLHQLEKVRR